MNTHQLECFITLARTLNFSTAAEQLFLTQPTISHQIKSLENEIGIRLFDRSSRSVSLTSAGRSFYIDVQDILNHMERSLSRAWNTANHHSRNLEIAYSMNRPIRLMPEILKEYRKQAPHIFPNLHECETAELYAQLLDGRRDVIFAPHNEEIKDHLYFDLYTAKPACIIPKDHFLASQQLITAEDIRSLPLFVSHEADGFPVLRSVWHYLEMNHEKGSIIYVDTVPVIYEYVRAGLGVSVVPPLSQQAENHLKMIPFDYPHSHHYGAHCLKGNEEAVRFCRIAAAIVKDSGAEKVLL